MKNFIWGILLFVFNLFVFYENYTKGFPLNADFFTSMNQFTFFALGILYTYQNRKHNIVAVASNSFVFTLLMNLFFIFYGNPVNYKFFGATFLFSFLSMYIGHYLYWMLFCPKNRVRKKKAVNRSAMLLRRK